MNEQLKRAIISAADTLLGPVFDELGTTRKNTSLTTCDSVDRETGQIIGETREIAGDCLVYMDSYSQRSTLRNRFFQKNYRKEVISK